MKMKANMFNKGSKGISRQHILGKDIQLPTKWAISKGIGCFYAVAL